MDRQRLEHCADQIELNGGRRCRVRGGRSRRDIVVYNCTNTNKLDMDELKLKLNAEKIVINDNKVIGRAHV